MLNHAKISSKGDGADPSLVQPSDWNADHVFTGDVTLPANLIVTGKIGIGHAPNYSLDILNNQNAATVAIITNSNAGNAAQAQFYVNTTTAVAQFGINGPNFTSAGLLISGTAYVVTSSSLVLGSSHVNGAVLFGTNNKEQMRLDANGNLGIGMQVPVNILDITKSINGNALVQLTNPDVTPGGAAQAAFRATNNVHSIDFGIFGSAIAQASGSTIPDYGHISCYSSGLSIITGTHWPIIFATNNFNRMTLDAEGNLGLGIAPPAAASTAARSTFFIGAAGSVVGAGGSIGVCANTYWNGGDNIAITTDATAQYWISGGGCSWYMGPSANAGTPTVGLALKMVLDAGGSLRVGTNTDYITAGEKLSVNGGIGAASYYCANDVSQGYYALGTAGSNIGRYAGTGETRWTSTQGVLACTNQGGGVLLSPGAGAWAAISSRAVKRDFTPIPGDPFAIIMGHEASLYRYIDDPDDYPLRPGLYYEDGAALYPPGVTNIAEHIFTDVDGSEHLVPERKLMAMELYIPLLMLAFQKQIALNATLDARLTAGGL